MHSLEHLMAPLAENLKQCHLQDKFLPSLRLANRQFGNMVSFVTVCLFEYIYIFFLRQDKYICANLTHTIYTYTHTCMWECCLCTCVCVWTVSVCMSLTDLHLSFLFLAMFVKLSQSPTLFQVKSFYNSNVKDAKVPTTKRVSTGQSGVQVPIKALYNTYNRLKLIESVLGYYLDLSWFSRLESLAKGKKTLASQGE